VDLVSRISIITQEERSGLFLKQRLYVALQRGSARRKYHALKSLLIDSKHVFYKVYVKFIFRTIVLCWRADWPYYRYLFLVSHRGLNSDPLDN